MDELVDSSHSVNYANIIRFYAEEYGGIFQRIIEMSDLSVLPKSSLLERSIKMLQSRHNLGEFIEGFDIELFNYIDSEKFAKFINQLITRCTDFRTVLINIMKNKNAQQVYELFIIHQCNLSESENSHIKRDNFIEIKNVKYRKASKLEEKNHNTMIGVIIEYDAAWLLKRMLIICNWIIPDSCLRLNEWWSDQILEMHDRNAVNCLRLIYIELRAEISIIQSKNVLRHIYKPWFVEVHPEFKNPDVKILEIMLKSSGLSYLEEGYHILRPNIKANDAVKALLGCDELVPNHDFTYKDMKRIFKLFSVDAEFTRELATKMINHMKKIKQFYIIHIKWLLDKFTEQALIFPELNAYIKKEWLSF